MRRTRGSATEPLVASAPRPDVLVDLPSGRWSLQRARAAAAEVEDSPRAAAHLVRLLFSDQMEVRKRAADVARRMTEPRLRTRGPAQRPAGLEVLRRRAEDLLGLLAAIDPAESRTRWHLGLAAARLVHTRAQRLRAARLMETLAMDESVVVRCSGIEGLGRLAAAEPCLRARAEEICEQARARGTAAERCRARDALMLLQKTAAGVQGQRRVL